MKKARVAEFLKRLQEATRDCSGDPEVEHSRKDIILVDFIRELGYNEIADEWEKGSKWYS